MVIKSYLCIADGGKKGFGYIGYCGAGGGNNAYCGNSDKTDLETGAEHSCAAVAADDSSASKEAECMISDAE